MRRLSRTRALADLATEQHGVVGRRQLLDGLGFSPSAVDRRLRLAQLHRIHPGVYAVGHRVLRVEGRWMAALLACGPGAALSHWDAAAALGLVPLRDGPIHVTLPGRRSRRTRGIAAHGCRCLPADETTSVGPLVVTSVGRVLLDVAARTRVRHLEAMISQADKVERFDLIAARTIVARYPTRPGASRLAALLDRLQGVGAAFTRSELEVLMLMLCDDHGLPRPAANATVLGCEVDFWWPEAGVVVEADSWQWHRMPTRRDEDAAKRLRLQTAGLRVIVLTYAQVRDTPDAVAASLRGLVAPGRG